MTHLEFGVETFGDVTKDATGTFIHPAQVIRNVVEEARTAERVGLDVFGIGEHHRDDYAISAPDTVLAGIATVTEKIRLGTAVTVLSSDDPVRIHERFATLDALSNGRAEIILGRGSFTESFPLFGYDLANYEELFNEKLELYMRLRGAQPVSWKGTHTQDLDNITVYPPYEHGRLKTWIAVGGSPQSVVRTAHYDLPLMLAIIGGDPSRFAPFADLYRRAQEEFGHAPQPVGYHTWGYVAETDEEAREEFAEPYLAVQRRLAKDRGWSAANRAVYNNELVRGSLAVGSPHTVARRIADGMKALGATRYDMKISNGPLSHEKINRSIELFGTKVVPLVKDMLA
ncbi:coenzyme F420-dependent N5,N10-methylene tetrahydromethanopterin reductase [Corynebacterium renale]|uniref:LLM class flavin-dependent oxidoreductase n=1 Tax=Corynebacterium renale TaxID=1724 RepID=UPI000DA2ED6B|nr:LLM class flavin-dependent oxidoreductase [Corynebacterium renale]SQG63585.1 coenzyme F420-dependent N5,N10-methylene tetrahydromethanopterin reductase [Corynebacterium renale]STD01053.1 coenzyme F420-dependent N5,N10-methylene tetrahydromethanopterin reductase [Corynebacterium renale]